MFLKELLLLNKDLGLFRHEEEDGLPSVDVVANGLNPALVLSSLVCSLILTMSWRFWVEPIFDFGDWGGVSEKQSGGIIKLSLYSVV